MDSGERPRDARNSLEMVQSLYSTFEKYTIRNIKKENKLNKSMDAFTAELRGRTFFSYSLFYALWDW